MISVITCTNRPDRIKNIFRNYRQQSLKKKELIIILNRKNMNLRRWRKKARKHSNVSVYQIKNRIIGHCYNFAVTKAKYAYISKFDDDDYYGPSTAGISSGNKLPRESAFSAAARLAAPPHYKRPSRGMALCEIRRYTVALY